MKKRKKKLYSLLIIVSLICTNLGSSFAHGPLAVDSGAPLVYEKTVEVRYDQGTLGQLSNVDAITLIDGLLNDWEISTASISIVQDSPSSIGVDVNETNEQSYIDTGMLLGYTPIIFDTDGELTDDVLGSGAKNSVIGFASPIWLTGGTEFEESLVVINGRFYDGDSSGGNPELSLDAFKATVIHEIGHAIGLDHSAQGYVSSGSSTELKESVPLMYPVALNDLFVLKEDDKAGIGTLYPNATFNSTTASISGTLYRSNGTTQIEGANIVARRTDDPSEFAYSCVSGYLDNGMGTYKLDGLPAGTYKIEIEPIHSSFTGGSSIGPHAVNSSDKSFQNPVEFGYYTGDDLPVSTDINDAATITVSGGDNLTGKDFIGAASSSSSGGCNGTIDEEEPNDSLAGAQTLDCSPIIISGSADIDDSFTIELTDGSNMLEIHDLFAFTQSSTGMFSLSLDNINGSSGDDLDLILFNSDASEIVAQSTLTGNADESISLSTLNSGNYLIGVGAFSGGANYSLNVSGESTSAAATLSHKYNKNTIILKANGTSTVFKGLMAKAYNFTETTNCTVSASYTDNVSDPINDPILDEITYTKNAFTLGNLTTNKKRPIKMRIRGINTIGANDIVQHIKDTYTQVNALIDISCDNGASASYTITIEPDASFRTFNRLQSKNLQRSFTPTSKGFKKILHH